MAVYLDYNATAPIRPEVVEAVVEALKLDGNPSSVHGPGRAARECIEKARDSVAALVGAADTQRVIFTSGGTEANNLALKGLGRKRLLVSAIEHPSVLNARLDSEILPVTPDGVVDLDALEAKLKERDEPALVALMLANNETGVIQPIAEAARIAHANGALLFCDAVQGVGKIPFDMTALGVDALSLSAHKLGGPTGVGALVLDEALTLEPQQRGGGQEFRLRAGTENLPGIAGFGKAADLARDLSDMERIRALRDRLEREAVGVTVFGASAPRLPNTSSLAIPGKTGQSLVMAFDLAGIALSAGSACSSGKVTASHVLWAMGFDDETARSAIRVSMGWGTTAEEVDRFLAVLRSQQQAA